MSIVFNQKQKKALYLMETGNNVFLTGPGGVGKSEVIKFFYEKYKKEKKIGLTSTTGISALTIGGRTLHSYLKIGLGTLSFETLKSQIEKNGKALTIWTNLNVLIIDEISMLNIALFEKIEKLARYLRNCDKPFGDIQIIASGDFCQLPPVEGNKYCFESEVWSKCFKNIIYLTEIIRQKDNLFQKCLNEIRIGIVSEESKNLLNDRVKKFDENLQIKPTKLHSTNLDVEYINEQELDKLAEDGRDFYEYNRKVNILKYTKETGVYIENVIKNTIIPEKIQLCIGAQVMLIFNIDSSASLVNGSRGVITNFIDGIPIVKFQNNMEIPINYISWDFDFNDEHIMSIKQIPLKVAYAMTIHKSQSCTLDLVQIDLNNCFAEGQAYVALSRVRNLEGLYISKINYEKIKCNPKAKVFYETLNKNE